MQLTDTEGASFGRAALLGHPSLMFFGDVACMNARPATLTTLHEVLLQAQMSNLRVLLITPDRGRDTSAQLKVHLRDFGPAFIGLYASREAIAPLVESLGANWALQESPGCANVSVGPATLYLVDSRAHLTAVFKPPYSSAALQDDLHTLAARSML